MYKALFALLGLIATTADANPLRIDVDGINIFGKVAEEAVITQNLALVKGDKSVAIPIGAMLKKGQRALFELEVQDRSGSNDKNVYECNVTDKTKGDAEIQSARLNLIEISQFSNAPRTSPTARLTSGTYSWAYIPENKEAATVLYEVSCGGFRSGNTAVHLLVRLKKTIFE